MLKTHPVTPNAKMSLQPTHGVCCRAMLSSQPLARSVPDSLAHGLSATRAAEFQSLLGAGADSDAVFAVALWMVVHVNTAVHLFQKQQKHFYRMEKWDRQRRPAGCCRQQQQRAQSAGPSSAWLVIVTCWHRS